MVVVANSTSVRTLKAQLLSLWNVAENQIHVVPAKSISQGQSLDLRVLKSQQHWPQNWTSFKVRILSYAENRWIGLKAVALAALVLLTKGMKLKLGLETAIEKLDATEKVINVQA